jgi:antirestriction protein ArdC
MTDLQETRGVRQWRAAHDRVATEMHELDKRRVKQIEALRAEVARLKAEQEQVAAEMRTIAMVAGQCSIEGPDNVHASMAAAEAERLARWADRLSPQAPAPKE